MSLVGPKFVQIFYARIPMYPWRTFVLVNRDTRPEADFDRGQILGCDLLFKGGFLPIDSIRQPFIVIGNMFREIKASSSVQRAVYRSR